MMRLMGVIALVFGICSAYWAYSVFRGPKSPFPEYMNEYVDRLYVFGGFTFRPSVFASVVALMSLGLLVLGVVLVSRKL